MASPFFSVLITAYNREGVIERCVMSALSQDDGDFEVVVVDDASTDRTPEIVESCADGRLRLVRHERNQGVTGARATALQSAGGQWLVTLDSDDELVSGALTHLRTVIDDLDPDVRIVRSRLMGDDGRLQPGIVPAEVTDYDGRMRWVEAVMVANANTDATHCVHASIYDEVPMFVGRRDDMQSLWEFEAARWTRSYWDPEVLIRQHSDADNSLTRDVDLRRLVVQMLERAPDAQWTCEVLLTAHRDGIDRHAPHFRLALQRIAATQAFLAGHRRAGLRHTGAVLASGQPGRPMAAATALAGLAGPATLARVKAAGRMARARLPAKR